jgi:hypothetical protein
MSLPWVRLDTQFATNPKVLNLIDAKNHAAIVAYVCSLGYSGAHGTDGYIPGSALPFIHGTRRHAQQLVAVGLWHDTVGGYQINDWDEYQRSSLEAIERREKAQRAAMARWHPDDENTKTAMH